ncbi:DUF7149 domain-containing protein [Helicobacter turcicus]|nr:Eco57I restriction-modification methylase domain-containing protein [Helicobacter turcicus]
MHYSHTLLQDFCKSYNSLYPTQEMLESFKKCLKDYLQGIEKAVKNKESEEHQKNILRDFLQQSFAYECYPKERIDLVISEDALPKVIFETKRLGAPKNEFMRGRGCNSNLESKAFYESILYYLRESITHQNNNITFIILTDMREFYLIDAREYTQFERDKEIVKAFKNCENKEGNNTSTDAFYKALESLLPRIDSTLKYTYFCMDWGILDSTNPTNSQTLANSQATTNTKAPAHTTNLALLYQVLSPALLLKHKSYLDANTLNQGFYDELLYILGLEEEKQSGKVLILPSKSKNTLLDSICNAFKLTPQEDFETIFALLTIWNNRLLFLRLLESMLLSFKHISKPFLDLEVLKDFQALNTLFFDVLARFEESRDNTLSQSLKSIPYLNSSLFEKTPLEGEGKEIKFLESKPLSVYKDSILYKDHSLKQKLKLKDKTSTLPLLEYLFAFLHAYNFTTTAQDIQNHTKTNYDKLINSAVLGLVFEKLNGYKEGSFYTPSFITSYMCKQSLQKVVLEKFNTAKNWECENLEELKISLDKFTTSKENYKEANAIFDSIHICDPAVGSGHFLVSALNALILLKFELRILCDENYERIKDISLEIIRDELVLRDSNNTLFAYTLPSHENIESHKIQKALFHTKRTLIESCLFGVDINPNSCEITKLRLWIELLKSSFYKDIENKRLETLPNIDINIKCGNSLVSYFDIQTSLAHYPNIKQKINAYKKAVENYKEGFYTDKNAIDKQIRDLHQAFKNFCLRDKFKTQIKTFEAKCEKYSSKYGNYLAQDDKDLMFYVAQRMFISEFDEQEAKKAFDELRLEYANIFNLESNKPFEWRFAFPEVLDSNGDFLGFDLIIGNPPYIRQEDIKHLKPQLQKAFSIYKGTSDIYTYFYEQGYKLLKNNGILSFITSNKWCRAGYGEPLRAFLLENTTLLEYVDFNGIKVFDSATVDTSVLNFTKAKASKKHALNFAKLGEYDTKSKQDLKEVLEYDKIPQSSLSVESFTFSDAKLSALKEKIEKIGTPLKDWDISINYGIKTGYNEAFIIDSIRREEILNACDDSKASLKPYPLSEYDPNLTID